MFIIFGRSRLDVWPVLVCTNQERADVMVAALTDAAMAKWKEAMDAGLDPFQDEVSLVNRLDSNAHWNYANENGPEISYEYYDRPFADDPGILALHTPPGPIDDEDSEGRYFALVDVM